MTKRVISGRNPSLSIMTKLGRFAKSSRKRKPPRRKIHLKDATRLKDVTNSGSIGTETDHLFKQGIQGGTSGTKVHEERGVQLSHGKREEYEIMTVKCLNDGDDAIEYYLNIPRDLPWAAVFTHFESWWLEGGFIGHTIWIISLPGRRTRLRMLRNQDTSTGLDDVTNSGTGTGIGTRIETATDHLSKQGMEVYKESGVQLAHGERKEYEIMTGNGLDDEDEAIEYYLNITRDALGSRENALAVLVDKSWSHVGCFTVNLTKEEVKKLKEAIIGIDGVFGLRKPCQPVELEFN